VNNVFGLIAPVLLFIFTMPPLTILNQQSILRDCEEDNCEVASDKNLVAEIKDYALIYQLADNEQGEFIEIYAYDESGETYSAIFVSMEVLDGYGHVLEDTPIAVSQEMGLYKLESGEYQLEIMEAEQGTVTITLKSLDVGTEYQVAS
jgi:hypothetical protein